MTRLVKNRARSLTILSNQFQNCNSAVAEKLFVNYFHLLFQSIQYASIKWCTYSYSLIFSQFQYQLAKLHLELSYPTIMSDLLYLWLPPLWFTSIDVYVLHYFTHDQLFIFSHSSLKPLDISTLYTNKVSYSFQAIYNFKYIWFTFISVRWHKILSPNVLYWISNILKTNWNRYIIAEISQSTFIRSHKLLRHFHDSFPCCPLQSVLFCCLAACSRSCAAFL